MADLSEGWKDRPPVQWMVQGYLGIKPQGKADDDGEFDQLVGELQMGRA
ncbi:MAG: hypothetical protein KGH75_10610 [Rhodospirillales bacterium]|nr:hypothetical protein [Rhodospirillales bacterium]